MHDETNKLWYMPVYQSKTCWGVGPQVINHF